MGVPFAQQLTITLGICKAITLRNTIYKEIIGQVFEICFNENVLQLCLWQWKCKTKKPLKVYYYGIIKYNMVYPFSGVMVSGKKDAVIDPKGQYAMYMYKWRSNYKLGCIFLFILLVVNISMVGLWVMFFFFLFLTCLYFLIFTLMSMCL